ncbi:hypothetical protein D3C87_2034700 [compost metagenome]
MSSQRARSSRKVSGSARNSQMMRITQRLPSKSSKAMMGRPLREPRTGMPGFGVAIYFLLNSATLLCYLIVLHYP